MHISLNGLAARLATYLLTFYCDPYLPFQVQNFCLYLVPNTDSENNEPILPPELVVEHSCTTERCYPKRHNRRPPSRYGQ